MIQNSLTYDSSEQQPDDILSAARACHTRRIIGHTVKFCDPYLERLPLIRDT